MHNSCRSVYMCRWSHTIGIWAARWQMARGIKTFKHVYFRPCFWSSVYPIPNHVAGESYPLNMFAFTGGFCRAFVQYPSTVCNKTNAAKKRKQTYFKLDSKRFSKPETFLKTRSPIRKCTPWYWIEVCGHQ